MKDAPGEAVLLADFLGAGKTTPLRNILQRRRDLSQTSILVNEFGRIGIDGEVLPGFQAPFMN